MVEPLFALLHLLLFITSVVVLIEYLLRDVHPIVDDPVWDFVVEDISATSTQTA